MFCHRSVEHSIQWIIRCTHYLIMPRKADYLVSYHELKQKRSNSESKQNLPTTTFQLKYSILDPNIYFRAFFTVNFKIV